jgi:hypothetical protein
MMSFQLRARNDLEEVKAKREIVRNVLQVCVVTLYETRTIVDAFALCYRVLSLKVV